MTDTPVTQADIKAAVLHWVGQKDRETFPEDLIYAEENWRSIAPVRALAETLANNRAQSEPSGEASQPQDELREALQDVKNWLIRYLGYNRAMSPIAKINTLLAKQERGE